VPSKWLLTWHRCIVRKGCLLGTGGKFVVSGILLDRVTDRTVAGFFQETGGCSGGGGECGE
jgi:hypothetical protein